MIDLRRASLLLGTLGVLGIAGAPACAAKSHEGTAGEQSAAGQAGTCDPDHPLDALTRLLSSRILPPRMFGGLGPVDGAWSGFSIEDMERAYCPSNFVTEDEQSVTVSWDDDGHDAIVTVHYAKSNHRVDEFDLNAGYKGTLDFASRPAALGDSSKPNPFGLHQYSIGVGRPVLRDGQPWELNWKTTCAAGDVANCWDKQATELFDGLMYTFAPELPSTQDSCIKQQMCLARPIGDSSAIFGARPLGIYFSVPNVAAPQPGASTPDLIYGFPVKLMPFSVAETFLKLDDQGPQAVAENLGDRHSRCVMKLGMSFASFLADCTQVLFDPTENDLLKKKLLGGASRTISSNGPATTGPLTATWDLDVTGFHPNFASDRFDEQAPPATAPATGLVLDSRSSGKVQNEYSTDGATLTLAGTAAIYREYARLVQEFLHQQMDPNLPRFSLGDASCLLPAGGDFPTWHPARGCTGMEQFVTPADPSTTSDPGIQRMSIGVDAAAGLGITSALRPGLLTAAFCADPGTLDHCDLESDQGLFADTRSRVIAVLGGGDASTVPEAARDRKVYVLLWTKAFVKYLRAASQLPTDLADPRFDALTPRDGDISIASVQDDFVTLKYLNKFEYEAGYLASAVGKMTFR